MADSNINVTLTANASQMAAELQKAQNELRDFEKQLKKASDVTQIQQLQAQITLTKTKIDALGKSNVQFARSSNSAAYALNDLSRIAQDAPYGFIGIQNNINPLLESFQRLRAESKLTGNSIGKELVGALTGPAGLGLAVGVVSAAITFASVGFDRWYRSTEKAKQASKDFSESLQDAEKGAIAQGVRLEGLIKIITDVTESEKNRNLALSEANKLLSPYGEKIDNINISLSEGKRLTDLYTEALVNQAISLKYADRIADLRIKKQENSNKQLEQNIKITELSNKVSSEATKLTTVQYGTSDRAALNFLQTNKNLNDAQTQLNKIKKDGISIQKELDSATNDYNSVLTNTLKITDKSSDKNKKNAKEIETISSVIKKLKEDLADQKIFSELFDESTLKTQFDLIKSAIEKLISDFNLKPDNKIILKLKAQLDLTDEEIRIQEFLRRAREKKLPVKEGPIEEKLVGPKIAQKVTFGGSFNQAKKEVEDYYKYIQKVSQDIAGIVENTIENVIFNLGEALGAALSGGNIGSFFENIFKVIGEGMQQLGKYFIQQAIIIEKIKTFLISKPVLAIAAGIALVAIGGAMKNAFNQNAFAVGTRNAPGGMALVGERGPEMVNLPRGSQVIPAAQTAQMMGGLQSIEVFGMLRGQDIYFSNKKYGQTYGRLT